MKRLTLGLLVVLVAAAGCRTTEEVVDPELVFGHRFDHRDPDERLVIDVEPPDPGVEYFLYPAVLSNFRIRTGPVMEDGRRRVELVVLGAFPDGCTHLYHVDVQRLYQQLSMRLDMWRPKGAICTRVVRPYRFYYELEEPLAPGSYTLHLNDETLPFQVFPPLDENR